MQVTSGLRRGGAQGLLQAPGPPWEDRGIATPACTYELTFYSALWPKPRGPQFQDWLCYLKVVSLGKNHTSLGLRSSICKMSVIKPVLLISQSLPR